MSAAKQIRSVLSTLPRKAPKPPEREMGGLLGVLEKRRSREVTVGVVNKNMAACTTLTQRLKIFDVMEAMGVERNQQTFTLAAEFINPDRPSSKYIIKTLFKIMSQYPEVVPDNRFLQKAVEASSTLDQAIAAFRKSNNPSVPLIRALENKKASLESMKADLRYKRFPKRLQSEGNNKKKKMKNK
eukprot:TRINITY_DN6875_c0_g1_i1.p1 TRINITY_DN6875_c0_g1~~TRINITY_DN6875_c0_g1_i1.p1  ORF type:complete len:185 (+),score=30.66 TRINITY_DN6875_c0_g1_i1:58-612(+)